VIDYTIQQIINALSAGSLYALMAVGLAMVFGILRLINFAHGDVMMIAAYLAFFGLGAGLPFAITVPLEALQSGEFETTGDVSLTSSQIGELLCDSKLQIIVTGPDGQPLDVGAAVYRPSRRLRRAVLHRDQGRCRYPGCDRTHGEVHHVIPFPAGKTVLANLVFLCDYHHHVLHKPGWHATFDGTTFTVTNPDRRHIGST